MRPDRRRPREDCRRQRRAPVGPARARRGLSTTRASLRPEGEMPKRHRRVVTGHDAQGRSVVLMDGESPHSFFLEKAGGLQLTELWETRAAHAAGKAGRRHPGMHKTCTVDYCIVLSGEIWAVLDEGEVLLRAGDCLVQRGTNHAWSNRTDKPCVIAFVLIAARPAP